ncbi:hypothetical protein [Polaromonas sp. CG_9.11]|uniref:hypothetical protein n=1 Tax=Polaromonas sp. CG_9.11 TaxID=2787730 RepID=UPI0018CB1D67|nr:hypothetical protein [Polaromonas sp. CG_9.11]MBG6075274.1 hypothetical protein [Polaromonas sp. CG_9.11]
MAGEVLRDMTQTHSVHVPCRGGGPFLQDFLDGQLDFMHDPVGQRDHNNILIIQAVKERIAGLDGEVTLLTPAEFGARAHEDTARFGKRIKDPAHHGRWMADQPMRSWITESTAPGNH